jgi:hypothetical protein
MKTSLHAFLILGICILQISCAQEKEKNNRIQKFPFTDANWSIIDKEGESQPMDTTMYDGKLALHLPVGHAAYLKNQKFKNFIAEFDVVGFVMPGMGFRLQDENNYELIYLRSNSSNKKDALQYIPIDNGNLPWQLFNYPKYEAKAEFTTKKVASFPLSLKKYFNSGIISDSLRLKLEEKNIIFSKETQVQSIDEKTWVIGDTGKLIGLEFRKTASNWEAWNRYVWTHVKIVVNEDQASVYVEDMNAPKMEIKNLKRKTQTGGICLKNQFFDAFFTDISVVELNKETQAVNNFSKETLPNNYMGEWELSGKFTKNKNDVIAQLDSIRGKSISWKKIKSDTDGLVNISRFIEEMSGSVALKTTIRSESEQPIKLQFGFAKHMIVVLNNEVLFDKNMDTDKEEGRVFVDDESIELKLSEGKNELIFVLTGDEEYKQNWGFIAKLEDLKGIEIE